MPNALRLEMAGRCNILITQKCQYAIRAIFELSGHYGQGPIKIAQIAETQAIPPRFLEVILSQLKQAGFVESRRGNAGGYFLVRPPAKLTVGDVIEFVQGPVVPVECMVGSYSADCLLVDKCVFAPMWEKVRAAISEIYDATTFEGLVEDAQKARKYIPGYTI